MFNNFKYKKEVSFKLHIILECTEGIGYILIQHFVSDLVTYTEFILDKRRVTALQTRTTNARPTV